MKIVLLVLVLSFSVFAQKTELYEKFTLNDGRVVEVFREDISTQNIGTTQYYESYELIVKKVTVDGERLDGKYIDVFAVNPVPTEKGVFNDIKKVYFVLNDGEGLHSLYELGTGKNFRAVHFAPDGLFKVTADSRIIPNSFRQVNLPVSGTEKGITLTYFEYFYLTGSGKDKVKNRAGRLLTDVKGVGDRFTMLASDKGIGKSDITLELQFNIQEQRAIEYIKAGDDIKFSTEDLKSEYISASVEKLAIDEAGESKIILSDEVARMKRIQNNAVVGLGNIKQELLGNLESSIVYGSKMEMIALESQGSQLNQLLLKMSKGLGGDFLLIDLNEYKATQAIEKIVDLLAISPSSVVKFDNWDVLNASENGILERFIKKDSYSKNIVYENGVTEKFDVSLKQATFVQSTRKFSDDIMDVFTTVSRKFEKNAVEMGWSEFETHQKILREIQGKFERNYFMKKLAMNNVFLDEFFTKVKSIQAVLPPTRYEFRKSLNKRINEYLKQSESNTLNKKVFFKNQKEAVDLIVNSYEPGADGNFTNRVVDVLKKQISKVLIAEQLLEDRKTINFKASLAKLSAVICSGAYDVRASH